MRSQGCVVCGESQGQREQQVQKLGPLEAQEQGAWGWVTGRDGEGHAGPVAGTKVLGSQWRTWEMSNSDYFTF